jgi:hypothetical protein
MDMPEEDEMMLLGIGGQDNSKILVPKERIPPKNSIKHRMAELNNSMGIRID